MWVQVPPRAQNFAPKHFLRLCFGAFSLLNQAFTFDRTTVEADGTVTVTVPQNRDGVNQLAVYEADTNNVIGWAELSITGGGAQEPDNPDEEEPEPNDPDTSGKVSFGSSSPSPIDSFIKFLMQLVNSISKLAGTFFGMILGVN